MNFKRTFSILAVAVATLVSGSAWALTLDWSGHFRADHKMVHNYQVDKSAPGYSVDTAAGGEYIQGQGTKHTTFSSMYLRLKPTVLVNDNVIIRSEWHVGDPVAGFFGRNIPSVDRNNPLSTQKDGMDITASRLWLDTHTDFGTLQVGRAPMHWGLGVVFNSADGIWDRWQSTSDTIRLVSKFGNLSLMPLYAKNAMGRNLAGSRNPISDAVLSGSDDVTDYGLGLRYNNPEEEIEAGILYYKRNANDVQNSYFYPGTAVQYTGGANGMNLKLLDLYARKKWKRLEMKAEVPLFTGEVGDMNGVNKRNSYRATSVALEGSLQFDTWKHTLKAGTAPGQGAAPVGSRGETFNAFSFHRAYKLGMILFNYNLGYFGAVNPDSIPGNATATSVNPYDAAISNARYVMFASEKKWEQWSLGGALVFAQANTSAESGKDHYLHSRRRWAGTAAVKDQEKSLGWEADFGTKYNWDDQIAFGADLGLLFPGKYFAFINRANLDAETNMVTAFQLTVGTKF